MTSKRTPCSNLYEPVSVSSEGFRIENAASVAIENCLNDGVHPTAGVVNFVTPKAPRSHKDQQGSAGEWYTAQSKAVISTQFQQASINRKICFGTDGVPYDKARTISKLRDWRA
jgi:hypothetical protein